MDIFANAKPTRKATTSAKANDKAVINIPGVEPYGKIDAMMKALKTLGDLYKQQVNDAAKEQLVAEGMAYGKRPQNFKGTDGDVTASIEYRKRSSASGLNDEEIKVCAEHNIPTEEVCDVTEGYMFNPDVMTPEVMAKIAKALENVKGLPENLIVKQVANKKTIVTEEAIDKVFATRDEDTIRALLSIVGVQAIKCSVPDFDMIKFMPKLASIVDPSTAFEWMERKVEATPSKKKATV